MYYGLGGPFYDATGGRFALRAYYPLVALWGDWSLSLMHSANAEIPARFLVCTTPPWRRSSTSRALR